MTTVCLLIIGITGFTCNPNAIPIGDCYDVPKKAIYCTAEIEDLRARASWYNPELCPSIPTNCYTDEQGNETAEYLGDGTPTAEGYGRFIACPNGLYSMYITFEHAGRWQCRDGGSAIVVNFGTVYTYEGWVTEWFITFDFLLYEPEWWTYSLLEIELIE